MSNYLILDYGVNFEKIISVVKFTEEELSKLKDNLIIDPSGEILSVKLSLIEDVIEDKDIKDIRNKRKPFPKSVKIKTFEDFLKVLAINIDIEEY